MAVPIYQVDAFTSEPFRGNPAAVCLLGEAKDADWMQAVAAEMNLSETAFPVRRADGSYDLRWFTPAVEVDLCGHATLATAHVLWESGALDAAERARFHTRSGPLAAERAGDRIELDFPAIPLVDAEPPGDLLDGLGVCSARCVARPRTDYLVELEDEAAVRRLTPDFASLKRLGVRGVIVTARSQGAPFDFVSRFFAPGVGVDEDPVTGSAHCALAPYWAAKLGKTEMVAFQASRRGGSVHVRLDGDRVRIAGHAVTVLRGDLCV
jgi:predicted PhzF superfamily epimerase YddE/YHI9